MLSQTTLDLLRKFDWQTIIDFGNSLDDLNDSQWRFLKGLVVELAVESKSFTDLQYVGEEHKDYNWPSQNLTVELKSQFILSIYTARGKLRKTFNIKFNNANGETKTQLAADQVADMLLVVRSDGAFAVDRNTVIAKAKKAGDGFVVRLTPSDVTMIAGPLQKTHTFCPNLKESVKSIIRQSLPA